MRNHVNVISSPRNRRSFLKTGLAAAGAVGTGLLVRDTTASAQPPGLTAGDTATLQFLAAGEALEADFYTQYNELGGIQDSEVTGGGGNRIYTERLRRIDPNIPQYIHDITDDEMSHQKFINAYLVSKGAAAVDLEPYRTLPGSTATGSSGKLRLTNLMQLTVDTSWWTRYRSSTNNPDVNPTVFEQAVSDLHNGKFTAIPRTDDDLHPDKHIQGHCQHRCLPDPDCGARRRQFAQGAGTKGYRRGSATAPNQHGASRDHAFPNLFRQGRQCTAAHRPDQWSELSRP